MARSSVFKTNQTQAVRLPRAVALPRHVRQVDILVEGNRRVIVPAGETWADFFASEAIDDDFLSDRSQPAPQIRKRK